MRGPPLASILRTRPLNEKGLPGHDTAPCEGRGLVSRHSHRVIDHGAVFARPPEVAKGASIPGP
jgi:hypothetical protein